MGWLKRTVKKGVKAPLLKGYVVFWSSIYGRVVMIVTVSLLFLFISSAVVFRSVNEGYMRTVIRENGNNIGLLMESVLYRSMLTNDRTEIQNTLDIINSMTGIEDVNMYDHNNNLAYSSISGDLEGHNDPNCKNCHNDFAKMFAVDEKSYRIIDVDSECSMNRNNSNNRYLLIKSPVLNSRTCYESSCHAHSADEKVLGSLIIKMPLTGLDNALHKSTTDYLLFATIIVVALTAFLIFFIRRKIKDPLHALVNASIAVANGDRSTRLDMPPNQLTDMRTVSSAFNNMLDNLQSATNELRNWSQQLEYKVQKKSEELSNAQNELINIERIASLGKLSLSVAHEINNPLSGILIYTKLLSRQLKNQPIDPNRKEAVFKHLGLIESETKRCGDIVKGLLDFSRKDQAGYEVKHLHEILIDTYELMAHQMHIANIAFMPDFKAHNDLINCSANQIKQVCVAILVNASEAVTENGEITFRTINPDDEHIVVEFVDNGIGISEEVIPHVFEPFFSTKGNTSGIGLGLSIVHGIVQSHKGTIGVTSQRGKGTTIAITFPLIADKERLSASTGKNQLITKHGS